MWLSVRLGSAELSSQLDKDLCSAPAKLSSRKQKPPGEQRQQYAHPHTPPHPQKNPTWKQQNYGKKPPFPGKKKRQRWMIASCTPDYQTLWESFSNLAERATAFVSSPLISSSGWGWILTCKRLSAMGNKLIISNQIFRVAGGGGSSSQIGQGSLHSQLTPLLQLGNTRTLSLSRTHTVLLALQAWRTCAEKKKKGKGKKKGHVFFSSAPLLCMNCANGRFNLRNLCESCMGFASV